MFEIGRLTRLELGYIGETESRSIQIDVREWLDRWPQAIIAIWVKRPDKTGYTAATEVEDGILTWVVTAGDVAQAGDGLAQIKALDPMDTGAIYKSRTVGTKIYASLEEMTSDPDAPDPMEAWANQAAIYKEEAYRAKEAAEASANAAAASEYRASEYGRQAYESATTAAYQAGLSELHANAAERAQQAAEASSQQAVGAAGEAGQQAAEAKQSATKAEEARQAAAVDASDAGRAANTATSKASEATTAAEEASSAAEAAGESASAASLASQKAATSAGTAVTAMTKAETSAAAAAKSAENAEVDRQEAADAADTATAAAEAAKKSEETAKDAKEDAVASAETAANAADDAEAAAEAAQKTLGTTAPGIELSATGEVVEISDGAARPALTIASQIVAVQTGTGDPTPDNIRPIVGWDALTLTRTGRNMLDPTALQQVQVSTGETRWGMQYTRPGTYALHANAAGGDADYVYARVTDASGAAVGDTLYLVVGSAIKAYTVTLEAGQTLTVWYVRDLDQATAEECLTRTQVQVEMGSRTAYEPAQHAAITAALPETVYGGSLDWTTGMLTVTHTIITLDSSQYGYVNQVTPHGLVNALVNANYRWSTAEQQAVSHFAYENALAANVTKEGFLASNGSLYLRISPDRIGGTTWADVTAYLDAQKAAGTPVQVLDKLAAPYTIQLDPQTIELLRGENRIWSEAGASAVAYIAETKQYIDGRMAENAGYAEYAGYAERAGEAYNALMVNGLKVSAVPITDWDTITPEDGTIYLVYDAEVTV